jgi:hypothetical protein
VHDHDGRRTLTDAACPHRRPSIAADRLFQRTRRVDSRIGCGPQPASGAAPAQRRPRCHAQYRPVARWGRHKSNDACAAASSRAGLLELQMVRSTSAVNSLTAAKVALTDDASRHRRCARQLSQSERLCGPRGEGKGGLSRSNRMPGGAAAGVCRADGPSVALVMLEWQGGVCSLCVFGWREEGYAGPEVAADRRIWTFSRQVCRYSVWCARAR